jgi:hypothetical protein
MSEETALEIAARTQAEDDSIREVCVACVAATIESADKKQVMVKHRSYVAIARRFLPPTIEIIVSRKIKVPARWALAERNKQS